MLLSCSQLYASDSGAIINEEVAQLLSESTASAVSVAFVSGNSIKTYHFGEFHNGEKPSDETLYDIGSITKTYTGLVLAQAVADGLVNLDDPVSRYLPQINRKAIEFEETEITIRDLATHLSGLPTDLSCNEPTMHPKLRLDCCLQHDDKDLLNQLNNYNLATKPGTNYRYSNVGVRILGTILQQVYDKPLEQLFEKFVFQRTGQSDTHATLSIQKRARWRQGEHENGIPPPDASAYFNAAGGLKSTVTDMGKYL
ncbi:beta-lactamase family protein [Alteromonas pelagimontana]|uniref:Beta-lactamase family protein n=1 Tax=Alteromonas pelagimontana TaxID=1858656 RepID=A0A6M4MAY6_9ALTE|nr:serine hydrolase domain-containing protein [Alteromonas pelagimontana]QJR80354.1 beta-lactamase family protein [Alteromonas pelagimontana]